MQQYIKQIRGNLQGSILFLGTNSVVSEDFNSLNWNQSNKELSIFGKSKFINPNLSTLSGSYSFSFLDGVSTPSVSNVIGSFYKEYNPTSNSGTIFTSGNLIYPNITTSSSGEFISSANLVLYTGNLSLLTSNEALFGSVNGIQIQTSNGQYNGILKGVSSVFRNLTSGSTVSSFVNYWANGFDADFTHSGTTNNMYGFYMDNQSTRSGNIPPVSNRWGVYIADGGYNYFAGRVGFGTPSPSYSLHVMGTSSTTDLIVTNISFLDKTRLKNTSTEIIINDDGEDINFRVEGDTNTHLLFADASADEVAIGTNNPLGKLHIQTTENSPVLVVDGLQGTFNLGKWQHYTAQADTTTTSTNTSNIITIPMVGEESITLTGKITARGSGNITVGGTFTAVAYCDSVSVNIVGTVDTTIKENSAGSPSFTVVASGSNIVVQVTGGGENLTWLCTYEYQIIAPPVS